MINFNEEKNEKVKYNITVHNLYYDIIKTRSIDELL